MHSVCKAQLTNLDYHKLFAFLVNFVFPGLFIISNWYLNHHSQNRPNIIQSKGKNMRMSVTKECLEHGYLKCSCLVDQSKVFLFLHKKHGSDGKKKSRKSCRPGSGPLQSSAAHEHAKKCNCEGNNKAYIGVGTLTSWWCSLVNSYWWHCSLKFP